MNAAHLPLVISGASGQLAQLVLAELLNSHRVPGDQIIATTRSPDKLTRFADRGVVVREANFNRPEQLSQAFSGGRRMLLISTAPEELPYVDGIRLRQHTAAIKAASEAGVRHVLYTSGPNPEPGTPCFWLTDHYKTELALINSGLDWTILRFWEWPDWHLSTRWLKALATGEYFAASGSGASNHVTRADCAKAAAGALLTNLSVNRRYDVTGAAPLTIDEIMSLMSEASGKPVRVVHGTPEEYEARLVAQGMDGALIPFFVCYERGVRCRRYSGTTNAIEELAGKKPTSLREFIFGHHDLIGRETLRS